MTASASPESSAPGGTAFVFAGGGSLGAVQVGMLKALVATGLHPDFVVGSSVGAINAAFFASRPDARGVAELERMWRAVRREDVFPASPVGIMWRLLRGRDHLVDPRPLAALITRALPVMRLEEAALPCHVIACDLRDGQEVVFASGPVSTALLASTSVPGVFPPVQVDAQRLVDGSVTNNAAFSVALRLGARRVVVLPTGFPCGLDELPCGPIALALHALTLLMAKQLVKDLEHYRGGAKVIVVPPPCPLAISPYDFSQSAALIDQAERSAIAWLEAGGIESPAVPAHLRPHHHHRGAGPA